MTVCTTGEAPVPVPPPMPRGDEQHVGAGELVADLFDHLFGGGPADIGLGAGAETFGRRHTHLDDAFGPRHGKGLGIRVSDDKIDALEPCIDHVVDGVTARAAYTENGNPRLQFASVELRHLSARAGPPYRPRSIERACLSAFSLQAVRRLPQRRPVYFRMNYMKRLGGDG
jgi:hypothetical protein